MKERLETISKFISGLFSRNPASRRIACKVTIPNFEIVS
jgi:hypothetical protein